MLACTSAAWNAWKAPEQMPNKLTSSASVFSRAHCTVAKTSAVRSGE